MTQLAEDESTLELDRRFEQPLERVAFEPGMLLGVEATRTEQDFHRRRLNRHQYWLHGYGTICGLPVVMSSQEQTDPDVHMLVRLLVRPGLALDGLGREVTLTEPYCLDLKQWLEAHSDDDRRYSVEYGGYDETNNELWLRASIRHQSSAGQLAPVMARKLNDSTDPVAHTRLKDCVLLSLTPEFPPPGSDQNPPWGTPAHAGGLHPGRAHGTVPTSAPLNADEDTYANTLSQDEAKLLRLHGALLHSLAEDNTALELRGDIEQLSEVLLARIRIELGPDRLAICNPLRIHVNNLVRPFVTTPEQLAHLRRNP